MVHHKMKTLNILKNIIEQVDLEGLVFMSWPGAACQSEASIFSVLKLPIQTREFQCF